MADTDTVDAPAPVAPIGTEPAAPPAWRASLPDDVRGEKALDSFKGQDWQDIGPALAKSFVETKKLVGAKTDGMIRVPGATATPEEKAAFHKALGVPDTAEGYQISRPEVALNGQWNEGAEKEFLQLAHRHGMTPAQVQAAIGFYGQWEAQKLADGQRQAQEVMGQLRKEWGPNYEANLGRANRAVEQFGGAELIDYLAQTGLGRHPAMVKTFVAIANAMVESGAMETGTMDLGTSAEEAQGRITAIMTDKKHAYWQTAAPGHEAAVREMEALHRIVAGREGNRVVASFRET